MIAGWRSSQVLIERLLLDISLEQLLKFCRPDRMEAQDEVKLLNEIALNGFIHEVVKTGKVVGIEGTLMLNRSSTKLKWMDLNVAPRYLDMMGPPRPHHREIVGRWMPVQLMMGITGTIGRVAWWSQEVEWLMGVRGS